MFREFSNTHTKGTRKDASTEVRQQSHVKSSHGVRCERWNFALA